jgi:hypothetical protein
MPGTNRSGGSRKLGHDRTEADGPPIRPSGMPDAWNLKWTELMEQLPQHVLRRVDGHKLKALVTLLCHEIELSRMLAADPTDDKSRRLYLQTVQAIHRESSLFGLSPADRKRLDMEPEVVDLADEWS